MNPPRPSATSPSAACVRIVLADSVTKLDAAYAGAVLVSGSHRGVIAACYAFEANVRAAIFNDAGVGLDDAGIAGLAWLQARGVAAATVAHTSARIADARDVLASGRISYINDCAHRCGVAIGMTCTDAVKRMRHAPMRAHDSVARMAHVLAPPLPAAGTQPSSNRSGPLPARQWLNVGGRILLKPASLRCAEIWGLDSIGLVEPRDAGKVLVIGSHGALHGGDPASALPVAAAAAFFHDAGRGKDDAGVTRLPVLAARGIPASTVDYRSARIGDARSLWFTGVLSCMNALAAARGAEPGMSVRDAAQRLL